MDSDRALIQTVDFFTPIVDDPYTFGAIAAANALSDVWAMGGEPVSALNIVGFPDQELSAEVLAAILQGGFDKIREAGAVLAGGHSVRDAEIKYGLAVTGFVHPDRIWRNGGARVGDVLVLTKPLGTGILTTARKRDGIIEDALVDAVASMSRLNRDAMLAGRKVDVHACTDITGNGLAGHAWEMARASGVELRFDFDRLPLFEGVLDAALNGFCPGGAKSNQRYVGDALSVAGLSPEEQAVILDPQTSGGLLFAVGDGDADVLLRELGRRGVDGRVVGEAVAGRAAVSVRRS